MYFRMDRNNSGQVMEAAKDRLENSPYRSVRRVSCEYDDGVLVLRGLLSSFYYKQLAQEAVVHLHGVLQVVNEIEVAA